MTLTESFVFWTLFLIAAIVIFWAHKKGIK
jgi:hypothetical protein